MARKKFAAAAALLALALALPASAALGQEARGAQPEPQAVQGFLYLSTPVPGLAPGAGQGARPQGGQGQAEGPAAAQGVSGADSSAAAASWGPPARGGFLAAVKSLAEKLRGLFRQGR